MPEAPAALLEFEQACAAMIESWAGALTLPSSSAEADVGTMSDNGLIRVVESLGVLARRVESLQARSATAVAARSRGTDPDADLARKRGFASAERLLCDAFGSRYTDAARLVAVGDATSQRSTITGQTLLARHPHVADALDSGAIGVDAAELIRRFLDRVAVRAERDLVDEAEQFLVVRAPVVGVDGIPRLTKQLEARLDPDGVRPREDEQRARRALTIWEDASGMINLRGAFDPATGAPIKLAIETLVGAELHRARDARRAFGQCTGDDTGDGAGGHSENTDSSPVDPVLTEERTITQLNADALADIARLSLTSADAPPALRGAVVVARIDHDALTTGTGHATIDGIDQPVSGATARELAASAGVIPMVLGGSGEVLDLGRAARLFTPAQKLALVERDGGCAWPGCHRPPSHTQAHHIRWWKRDRGPTDLSNGVMLCSHHHHRVHDDGWHISVRDHRTWFTPPVHLDAEQRPRAGNSPRRHLPQLLDRRSVEPANAGNAGDTETATETVTESAA
jgi:hypothetical protein